MFQKFQTPFFAIIAFALFLPTGCNWKSVERLFSQKTAQGNSEAPELSSPPASAPDFSAWEKIAVGTGTLSMNDEDYDELNSIALFVIKYNLCVPRQACVLQFRFYFARYQEPGAFQPSASMAHCLFAHQEKQVEIFVFGGVRSPHRFYVKTGTSWQEIPQGTRDYTFHDGFLEGFYQQVLESAQRNQPELL